MWRSQWSRASGVMWKAFVPHAQPGVPALFAVGAGTAPVLLEEPGQSLNRALEFGLLGYIGSRTSSVATPA